MMVDRPVRVAIIGLGSIGTTHARALAAIGSEVRVVRASGGTAAELEALAPGARHGGLEELLDDSSVDVVAVCSPSGRHAEQALEVVRRGRAAVVEKPVSIEVAQARELASAARRHRVLVAPVAQRRFEPQHARLHRQLQDGTLGRPVLGEVRLHWWRADDYYAARAWRRDPAEGAGSLFNQGLHSLDLLLWLLGPVRSVSSHQATLGHDLEIEDSTVATLEFLSGALGVVVTSTATPPGTPAELALFTHRGSVEFEQSSVRRWDFPGVAAPDVGSDIAGGASDPAAIGVQGHVAQWRDILRAFRTGEQPAVTVEDALATVEVIDAIHRAADTGRTVRL